MKAKDGPAAQVDRGEAVERVAFIYRSGVVGREDGGRSLLNDASAVVGVGEVGTAARGGGERGWGLGGEDVEVGGVDAADADDFYDWCRVVSVAAVVVDGVAVGVVVGMLAVRWEVVSDITFVLREVGGGRWEVDVPHPVDNFVEAAVVGPGFEVRFRGVGVVPFVAAEADGEVAEVGVVGFEAAFVVAGGEVRHPDAGVLGTDVEVEVGGVGCEGGRGHGSDEHVGVGRVLEGQRVEGVKEGACFGVDDPACPNQLWLDMAGLV